MGRNSLLGLHTSSNFTTCFFWFFWYNIDAYKGMSAMSNKANGKKKSTNKKVDKKLDELLKDKKTIENTTDIKGTKKKKTTTKKTVTKKSTSSVKKDSAKKSTADKKTATKKTTKKTTTKKATKKTPAKKKFVMVSDEKDLSTKKLDELSNQIRDLYEKVEEKHDKKESISIENVYVNDSIEDERLDKAYIILNRITIILFIIFMILLIAFIAFVIYICTY